MWHSLVARIVRDDEAAGSNPVIPTILARLLGLSGIFLIGGYMDTLIKTHYDAVCERYGEDNVFFVFLYGS